MTIMPMPVGTAGQSAPRAVKGGSSVLELLAGTLDGTLGDGRALRRPRWYMYSSMAIVVALVGWMAVAQVDQVVRTQGRS